MRISCGKLDFRLVEERDAKFIFELRQRRGESLNVTGTLDDQLNFIKSYKERERDRREFYFMISDDKGDVGVVRIYKIDRGKGTFVWGSWILKEGASPLYALISSIMLYEFAFNHLGLTLAILDVRNENTKVISFHKKTGARFTHKDDIDTWFEFDSAAFEKYKAKYKKYVSEIRISE